MDGILVSYMIQLWRPGTASGSANTDNPLMGERRFFVVNRDESLFFPNGVQVLYRLLWVGPESPAIPKRSAAGVPHLVIPVDQVLPFCGSLN